MRGRPASSCPAIAWRAFASSRFRASRWSTVPSSSQRQAMAVVRAGVFQVVARIARSSDGAAAGGATTKPTRRPVATLLDSPET